MFVYDFVTLDRPFGAVVDALTADPGSGALAEAVEVACSQLASGNGRSHHDEFEVGEARAFEGTVTLPIRWTPTAGGAPFERLDGFVQVAPFEPDGAHVSVSASCSAPRASLGRRRDSQRLQRQTEAGVRVLLRELARTLAHEA